MFSEEKGSMQRNNMILVAASINAILLVMLVLTGTFSSESPQELGFVSSQGDRSQPQALDVLEESTSSAPAFALIQENNALPVIEEEVSEIKREKLESKEKIEPMHKLPPIAAMPDKSLPSSTIEKEPKKTLSSKESNPIAQKIVVKKGDSLDKLAKLYKTSVAEIIRVNQLKSIVLQVGQILVIPSQNELTDALVLPSMKESAVKSSFYTVKVGDNPWSIAMKHHMKVSELLRINGLDEARARQLKPGDRLKIH